MKIFVFFFSLLFFGCSCLAEAAVQAPVLKWKYGGCYSSWCETGWYSSPAVADLDGNGSKEIIASAYSVVALKGTTGEVIWRVDSGKDRTSAPGYSHRTWPGIWVMDVDGDHKPEIITAHSGGYVSVYDNRGYLSSSTPIAVVLKKGPGTGSRPRSIPVRR